MNELEALLALTSISGLGPVRIRVLKKYFGSAVEAVNASVEALSELHGISWQLAEQIAAIASSISDAQAPWRRDRDLAEKMGVAIISVDDPRYPAPLFDLPDAPTLIYVKGTLKETDRRAVAVIGTRNASVYGTTMAEKLSTDLAAYKQTIVSGLARGIDTAGHCGALKIPDGRTLAVIGSGLARLYPRENRHLADRIAENGALISEFGMEVPPDKQTFPRRNRLVSALSRALLLIEAPLVSGAMMTMRLGKQHKRILAAIPGRLDHPNFEGNHEWLHLREAHLIRNARDLMVHLEPQASISPPCATRRRDPYEGLDQEEQVVVRCLEREECSIDELFSQTKLPIARLTGMLIGLVIKKRIRELPGKRYQRLN
ncbi:MAG: DNA-processing protein DprA [Chlamydiia bacterium]|nr:DNA-processing protein DprA [Chlamydiia bacterium]